MNPVMSATSACWTLRNYGYDNNLTGKGNT